MQNHQRHNLIIRLFFCLTTGSIILGSLCKVHAQLPPRTPINYVEFSTDGSLVAAAYGHQVGIWKISDKLEVNQIQVLRHPAEVSCLNFSPDSKILATCGNLGDSEGKGFIALWSDNYSTKRAEILSSSIVESVTFSSDGRYLVAVNDSGEIEVISISAGRLEKLSTLKVFTKRVVSVAISPDQAYVAAGDASKHIKIWKWPLNEKSRPIRTIEQFDSRYIPCLRFSKDSQYIYAAMYSIQGFAYNMESPERDYRLPFLGYDNMWDDSIGCLDLSKDDHYLAMGYLNGRIRLFEQVGSKYQPLEMELGHHFPSSHIPLNPGMLPKAIRFLSFSPKDDHLLVSGANDGEVKLWKLPEKSGGVPMVLYLRNVVLEIPVFGINITQEQINHVRETADRNRIGRWMNVELQFPQGTKKEVKNNILKLGSQHSKAAQEALLKMGSEAVPALIAALEFEDWRLRLNAASVLSKMGSHTYSTSAALVSALEDGNDRVTHFVEEAILNLGTDALADLIEALKSQNKRLSRPAREIIVKIGPKAVPALIATLDDEHMWFEVERAISMIGPMAESALIAALEDQKQDAKIRVGAAWVLGEIDLPLSSARKAALSKALNDHDQRVREIAAEALKELQDK